MAGAMGSRVEVVLAALRAEASQTILAEMGPRYGLVVDKAIGVAMNRMQAIAKPLGPDHELARPSGPPAGTRPGWSPA